MSKQWKNVVLQKIFAVFLALHFCNANSNGKPGKLAEMKEVDVLVGDPITLNCTLLQPQSTFNSSAMYFKFGNTRVDDKYVTRPDPLTITLNITATLDKKGHIFCHAENHSETLAHQVVEVHNRPITPYNLSCVVKNWTSMECSWEPSAQEQKEHTNLTTNQTLYWVLLPKSTQDENGFWCPYLNAAQNQCIFKGTDGADSFRPDMDYEVEVVAANILAEASAAKTTLTKYLVQPGPIIKLKFGNVSSDRFEIKWRPPRAAGGRELVYSFHIIDNYGSTFQADKLRSGKRDLSRYISKNIKPFRNYTVSVRCIPYIGGKEQGFWSEPVTISVMTDESVPASAPRVTAGGFEPDTHNKKVVIYWQPIPETQRNGELTMIRVNLSSSGEKRLPTNVSPSATSATLTEINSKVNYTVFVEAATREGFNTSLLLSPITIRAEPNRLRIPEEFVVRYNTSADRVMYSWHRVDEASFYTIYSGLEKNRVLVWQSVPSSITELSQQFEDIARIRSYSFAISAEQLTFMTNISSGLHFTNCAYDATKTIITPEKVHFAKETEQKANSLKLSWNFSKCKHEAYVQHYVFVYWKIGSDQNLSMPFSPEETFAVLPKLEADAVYGVSVQSRSRWQQSSFVYIGQRQVTRDGFTQPAKIGIGFGVAFVSVFIIIGIISIFCFFRKKYRQIQKGPDIVLPDHVKGFEEASEDDDDHVIGLNSYSSNVTFLPNSTGSPRVDHSVHQPLLNGREKVVSMGQARRCEESALGPNMRGCGCEPVGAEGRGASHEDEVGASGEPGPLPTLTAHQEGGAENPQTLYHTSGRSSIDAYCKMAPLSPSSTQPTQGGPISPTDPSHNPPHHSPHTPDINSNTQLAQVNSAGYVLQPPPADKLNSTAETQVEGKTQIRNSVQDASIDQSRIDSELPAINRVAEEQAPDSGKAQNDGTSTQVIDNNNTEPVSKSSQQPGCEGYISEDQLAVLHPSV